MSQGPTIADTDEIRARATSGYCIVDCRDEASFSKRRVAGAVLVPGSHGADPPSLLAVSDEDALARLPADKSTQIFTYCASGRRANKVETALRALGFSQVTSCGGIEHMLRSGLAPAMCQNADPEQSGVTVRQLFDRESCTYTYILVDNATNDALLIDPVLECVDRDLEVVTGMGVNLVGMMNTHVHADHITGTGRIKSQLGADAPKSIISSMSGAKADMLVSHGDAVCFGTRSVKVRATPGHTPGCVTYVLDDDSCAFCGDALLIRGCGRTDFQGGDPALLYESVWGNILSLPDSTAIYPGHDYMGRTMTTVAEEKAHNPRLTKNKEEFIAFMLKKFDGSRYPAKLDVSLPANMCCGVFDAAPESKQ